jgi:hypothetical protein
MTPQPCTMLLIPAEGPLQEITLGLDSSTGEHVSTLDHLQTLVGGCIEAVPLPDFIPGADRVIAYVNEEGKFDPACQPNMRATDFMVPGVGLFFGTY